MLPVLVDAVLDFMEGSCDGMKYSADNSQDESSPRQVTRPVLRVRRVSLRNSIRILSIRSQVAVSIAMLGSNRTASRACENRDGDESAHKCKIKQNPEPSQPLGSSSLDDALNEGSKDRVEHSGREDAFDGTECARYTALCLDGVDETIDFVQARGEDAEGDNSGEELQYAGEAKKPTIGSGVLKLVRDEAGKEAGLAFGRRCCGGV